MPVTLSTTVRNIASKIENSKNVSIVQAYRNFMKDSGKSESYQKQNLKCIISLSIEVKDVPLTRITSKKVILDFLNSKQKLEDPDQKWITTWNDYLTRIRRFYRWLHNQYGKDDPVDERDWVTPEFLKIKNKKTKRVSPYFETELWERNELALIIKYEQFKRNKAAIALMWDLDARPHEITMLKIKHIRLKEKYGEGEIPYQTKTGGGPTILTFSFPYVRDWLNEHPFRNEINARLICNHYNGSPIESDSLLTVMMQLKSRISKLVESNQIENVEEKQKLEYLLKTKKWNPYCIRHSGITDDSDYLPEYALKKKCRWTMNSKQGARYIKNRMGDELKQKILLHNGIISSEEMRNQPSVLSCPRCELVNALENKYCSKCSYPLVPSAFDEIKLAEEEKIQSLGEKYDRDIGEMKERINLLVKTMTSVDQRTRNSLAKSLVESGLFK